MENNKYITVSQLNKYLKYKIDNDPNLGIILKIIQEDIFTLL